MTPSRSILITSVRESLVKLQDNGVTFKKTYCDSPLCVPSRAALLSGEAGPVSKQFPNISGFLE